MDSASALGVLGLPPTCADRQAIKRAYLALALRHHPDKGGDPARFREIQVAYDKLVILNACCKEEDVKKHPLCPKPRKTDDLEERRRRNREKYNRDRGPWDPPAYDTTA